MSKYPLKPLLEHRERRVDDASVELGRAVRAREEADRRSTLAEARKREAEASAEEVRASEAERFANGELRAVDLERAVGWEIGARAHIDELARTAAAAAQGLREAEATATEAQRELAGRVVDRDVVAKDESRFQTREKQRAVAKEEEAADDVVAARDRGRR